MYHVESGHRAVARGDYINKKRHLWKAPRWEREESLLYLLDGLFDGVGSGVLSAVGEGWLFPSMPSGIKRAWFDTHIMTVA